MTSATAPGAVVGEVVVVEPTGAETELLIQAGEAQLILVTHGRPDVNPGDRIGLAVDPGKVHVFDQGSGARLRRDQGTRLIESPQPVLALVTSIESDP